MNAPKSIYLLWSFLFAGALFYLVMPVQASPVPIALVRGATWMLDVTFDESKPNPIQAEWTVYLKDASDNVITQSSEYLTCYEHGAVFVNGEIAVFRGGGIACDMPSLIDRANALAEGRLFTTQEQTCEPTLSNVWVQMKGGVSPTAVGTATLFEHESFAYQFYISDTVRARLSVDGGLQTASPPITVTSDLRNVVASRIHDCNMTTCTGVHYLNNGEMWDTEIAQVPINLQVLSTTVYIGNKSTLSQPFYGRLTRLRSDPGCTVIPVN